MVSHHSSLITKTHILESALRCFARNGYEATGIREITGGADVNVSLVAYHFGGKSGLYEETLHYIFQRKISPVVELMSVLPTGPNATRQELVQGLKDYIRGFTESLMSCDPSNPMDVAAMTLLAREMESPTHGFEAVLVDSLRPFVTYLEGCLSALRPDLDGEARLAMAISIQGQIIYLRNALGIIRLLRNNPAFPVDLPRLIRHFVDFSLRGLDLPEASLQGACGAALPI